MRYELVNESLSTHGCCFDVSIIDTTLEQLICECCDKEIGQKIVDLLNNHDRKQSITKLIYLPREDIKDSDISETIVKISEYLNEGMFSEYDDLLATIQIEKISVVMMVALLRTSFVAKSHLLQWTSFLTKAKNQVVILVGNDNSVFHGLG